MTMANMATTTTTGTVEAGTNPGAVYLSRLTAPLSRSTMSQALDVVAGIVSNGTMGAREFPWGSLRREHVQAVRAELLQARRPATVNKILSALRGVLEEAEGLGLIPLDDYRRAIGAIKNVKGETLPAGRSLSTMEISSLATVCHEDVSLAGARDGALLALLFVVGLRRAEAVSLDFEDVNLDEGTVRVVHGKGRKERLLPIDNGGLHALQGWARARGSAPGPFLLPVQKNGVAILRRMTAQSVYMALRKRASQARVSSFSPHDLRRSFASELLDRGADIVTVQKLMGHSSPTTTARYDRRGEATKRAAVKLLPFKWAPA